MSVQIQRMKVAVSVTEMARMVGLSRARFYQLQKEGAFPKPSYAPETGRPFYTEDQQAACLDVRRRNCGIDGKPILFYARRVESHPTVTVSRSSTPAKPPTVAPDDHAGLLEAVKVLGMTSATVAQVRAAVTELYPQGVASIDQGEVIRAVFLHLKRLNSVG